MTAIDLSADAPATGPDAEWLLSEIAQAEQDIRAAEAHKLALVAQWCHLHPADPSDIATGRVERVGGDGCPPVAEFTAEPLAVLLQTTCHTTRQLMADVLDLVHRHPRLWARVERGEVASWRARRIVQATTQLSRAAAAEVDAVLAPRAVTCGTTLIERTIAEAVADADPVAQVTEERLTRASWDVRLFHGPATGPGRWAGTSILEITGDTHALTGLYDQINQAAVDLGRAGDDDALEVRRARAAGRLGTSGRPPRVRLYLHTSLDDLDDATVGTGSVERLGPLTAAKIKDWVGHSAVTILPVLRTGRMDAVDQHDPPTWMREQVILRDSHCVFPHCSTDARSCDLDHIEPYVPMDEGGPAGQTRPEGLAPLCRRHHRAKTAGLWHYRRNPDGTYTWTSPQGRTYVGDE